PQPNFHKIMDYDNEPSKVVFEGEEFPRFTRSFQTPTPKIIQWVIKYSGGLIKDGKQASFVLLGFVVAAIIVSMFLFFGSGSSSYNEKIIPPMPAAGWRP
ncbi:MAG: hypothetical protein KGJ58_03135, partial [Patescibacteria group bacterium]|nr:hypothetical protein [Patescibacteria group bacterium]MDE2218419.1 hypothetical protein [Patescibacteria group bacterium]